ncbi:MAG: hypothetical protein J2P19_05770 [Pseudonocardia sp.]|nr:hypothetical protein [Pseudonocardia sp.]
MVTEPAGACGRNRDRTVMAVAMRYEVRVAGQISDWAARLFRPMRVTPVPPETTITGPVADDRELHLLLSLCHELGFRVVAVQEAPASAPTRSTDAAGDGPAIQTP